MHVFLVIIITSWSFILMSPNIVKPDEESPPDADVVYLVSDSAFVHDAPIGAYVLAALVFDR